MGRKILNYIKYTKNELRDYVNDEKSCIERITNKMHIDFPPSGLANFNDSLKSLITRLKVGNFDKALGGIVLDANNIKVLGNLCPIRYDSPELHLDIQADFFLFKPQIGSVIAGLVKHISHNHIGVIIYRVFNVSIHLRSKLKSVKINEEISFRIKSFDLQNAIPFIEGELVEKEVVSKKIFFDAEEMEEDDCIDSGISTEETSLRGLYFFFFFLFRFFLNKIKNFSQKN